MEGPRRTVSSWWRRPMAERSLAVLIVQRLRWALLALAALFGAATSGYVVVEHYDWLDAAYMTTITLSTVGYGEVRPLHHSGRILTVGVIAAGFITAVYAVVTLSDLYSSGEAAEHLHRRRRRRERMALVGHVIVVGFGRVGQSVLRGIQEYGAPCLVIDRDASKEALARASGAVVLVGDATSEEDLAEAGIARASALVAAAESDEVNLVVVLTARALNPGLRIVSRVNDASWARRITNAGADVVQSPYPSYGSSLAAAAVTPSVVDLHVLPLLGIGTEEISVDDRSPLVGRSLETIAGSHPGAFIVGLRREERLRSWDQVSGPLLGGDVLVALGRPVPLRALAQEAVGREPPSPSGEDDDLARVGRPVDGVGEDVGP